MKKPSHKQLPSLSHTSTTQPSSRSLRQSQQKNPETVRQIEAILAKHESEINKNQKIILQLVDNVKILKQELEKQIAQNKQQQQHCQNIVQQNQKLMRKQSNHKNLVTVLQVTVKQKQKQIKQLQSQKQQLLKNIQVTAQMKQKIQKIKKQCDGMKKIVDRKVQENKALNSIVEKLQNQNMMLKGKNSQKNLVDQVTKQLDQAHKNNIRLQTDNYKLADQNKKYHNVLVEHTRCQEKIARLEQQTQNLTLTNQTMTKTIDVLEHDKKILNEKLNVVQKQMVSERINFNQEILRLTNQQNNKDRKLLISDKELHQKKKQLNEITAQLQKLKVYQKNFTRSASKIQQLQDNAAKIRKSLVCDLCSDVLKNPVTSIPCGHSFCSECKKGYEKECYKCKAQNYHLKRQAVYRNQLMDQFLVINKIIESTIKTLKR